MAKIANLQEVAVNELKPYERNAKIHGKDQIEKLKESIQAFGFLTPCLIDREKNLIAGHGRVMAAKELGIERVPCVMIEDLTDEQRRAYILADNRLSELGTWDMETVNDELFTLRDEDFRIELTGFELPDDWFENRERFDRSRQEGNEEYNDFLEKFEDKKTTDDCYTPDNVYEAVADYVEKRYKKDRKNFVRPFFPGGDYQAQKYKPNDIVVDNPPFSILAEIVDFYVEHGQAFFLFAPGLATLNYCSRKNVASLCTYAGITYENGASVTTSFLTNMEDQKVVAMTCPELYKTIKAANDENERLLHRDMPKYEYPAEVITAAKMGWLSKYGQTLVIKRDDSMLINELDAQKEIGKTIYGKGLLLSERAAAERAAAQCFQLSERERELVKTLGGER